MLISYIFPKNKKKLKKKNLSIYQQVRFDVSCNVKESDTKIQDPTIYLDLHQKLMGSTVAGKPIPQIKPWWKLVQEPFWNPSVCQHTNRQTQVIT